MSARSDFYVYMLTYGDGTPFYIGKGRGNRDAEHAKRAKRGDDQHNPVKHEVILHLLDTIGYLPLVKIEENLTEQAAFDEECRLIALYGREPCGPLLNLTAGGDGAVDLSPAIYAKMVAAQTAAAQSPKGRADRSARSLAMHADTDFKVRHAAAIKAALNIPETRAAISAGHRLRYQDPKNREVTSKASTEMHARPEFKEKHREAMQAASSTQEARARLRATSLAGHAARRAAEHAIQDSLL